jgi:hypothetical protein
MKKSIICFVLLLALLIAEANQDKNLKDIFEQAQTMPNKNHFGQLFMQLAEQYPEHLYGQKALLELGKIAFLEKNYIVATDYFKKIYFKEINEKEYWLGKAYLHAGEYHHAILSAQNYIFDSQNTDFIEESYFIIAESYIRQGFYQRALNTLDFLRQSKYIKNHIPFLYYQIVVCHINTKNYEQANIILKKMKTDFTYDYYTYLAEEDIFSKAISNEFIFSPIPELSIERADISNPNSSQKYLQVGAFSTLENALNMKKTVNSLGLDCIAFQKHSAGKVLFVAAAGPFNDDITLENAKQLLGKNNISSIIIQR